MKYRLGIMVVDYDIYIRNLPHIKNEIKKDNCEVIAITCGWLNESCIGLMDGFKYYDIGVFLQMPFDYLIIAVQKDAFGLIKEKIGKRVYCGSEAIFPTEIFGISDFDFEKYIELVKSKISIISCNCWGGLTYANLFLEFRSPTINLRFENEEHFLRFVSDMDYYLSHEVMFDGMEFDELIGEYPAGLIGDVRIRFVHYKSFEDAVDKWYKRIQRINRENIFLMLYTEDEVIAKTFDLADGFRKVVFTAGDYGAKCQIDVSPLLDICPLQDPRKITLLAASGELHLYNAIKMLNGDMGCLETKGR